MRITRAQVVEVEPHRYVTDASDLNLPVGAFPATLETDLGNGMPLVRTTLDAHEAVYQQALGVVTLTVFND